MSINALQKAVFEILSNDAAILALTGPGMRLLQYRRHLDRGRSVF